MTRDTSTLRGVSTSRKVASSLAALAGCALLWLLILLCRSGPTVQAEPSTNDGDGAAAVADRAAAVHEAATDASPSRETVMAEVSDADVAATTICVVDCDGEPVAGAEVLFVPPGASRAQPTTTGAREADLRARGSVARTDEAGQVVLRVAAGTSVVARAGRQRGELDLGAFDAFEQRSLRLWLRQCASLTVRVVDAEGRPAPGQLVRLRGDRVTSAEGALRVDEELGVTDARGELFVEDLLARLDLAGRLVDAALEVCCERRVSDVEEVQLARAVLPFATLQDMVPVELVVPAGGDLAVVPVDARGNSIGACVVLLDESDAVYDLRPEVEGDRHVFRRVPVGRRWRVRASLAGVSAERVVAGPAAACEQIVVRLPLDVLGWQIRARVVREDGVPVNGARVQLRCPGLGGGAWEQASRPDGSVVWGATFLAGSVGQVDQVSVKVDTPLAEPLTIAVDKVLEPGVSDLGDLVVRPLRNERLLASVLLHSAGGVLDARAWAVLAVRDAEGWQTATTLCGRVDGRLEFRGVPPAAALYVRCGHPDCVATGWLPIGLGEHEDIALERSARLLVAVRAPPVPPDALTLSLVSLDTQQTHDDGFDAGQQLFRFQGLRPGSYRLVVRFDGSPIHEEARLELRPGEQRWPAQGALDLRAVPRALLLAARDATDGHFVYPEMLAVAADATTLPAEDEWRVREEWFVQPPVPEDLLVRHWDYVPARVRTPLDDVLLQLQRATVLEVELINPEHDAVVGRIVHDAVTDPMLRAFDEGKPHRERFDLQEFSNPAFAPGSIVEFTVVRGRSAGPPRRVVVGAQSPQRVVLE